MKTQPKTTNDETSLRLCFYYHTALALDAAARLAAIYQRRRRYRNALREVVQPNIWHRSDRN